MSALPDATEIELADDAAHVATLEAAILVLSSRHIATESGRERWQTALNAARSEFARQRTRPLPKIAL